MEMERRYHPLELGSPRPGNILSQHKNKDVVQIRSNVGNSILTLPSKNPEITRVIKNVQYDGRSQMLMPVLKVSKN